MEKRELENGTGDALNHYKVRVPITAIAELIVDAENPNEAISGAYDRVKRTSSLFLSGHGAYDSFDSIASIKCEIPCCTLLETAFDEEEED